MFALLFLVVAAYCAEPSLAARMEPFDGPLGSKLLAPIAGEGSSEYVSAWLTGDGGELVLASARHLDILPLVPDAPGRRVRYELAEGKELFPHGFVDRTRLLATLRTGDHTEAAVVDTADGAVRVLELGKRLRDHTVRRIAAGPGLVALCVTDPDGREHLVLYDLATEKVRWTLEVRPLAYAVLQVAADGGSIRYDEDYYLTKNGEKTGFRRMPGGLSNISVPGDAVSRWTFRSKDQSTVLQVTTEGAVHLWPTATLDPLSAEVADAITRVRASDPASPDALVGHWRTVKALLKSYDRAEQDFKTVDYSDWIGMGGFSFEADGVVAMGILQAPGSWSLEHDGRALLTTDVRGRDSRFEIRVDGDTMEWIQAEDPTGGDFRVDVYVRMQRD